MVREDGQGGGRNPLASSELVSAPRPILLPSTLKLLFPLRQYD